MLHPLLSASGSAKPKPLDQVRDAIRLRHYSLRMEQAYSDWIRRFTLFHNKIICSPREASGGPPKATGKVAAATASRNPKNPRHPR